MTPPPAEQFAARIFIGPALRAQPDRRLVDLVRDGYDAAFEEIVRRYRRPLDRFAATFVGGRSEDVTQDSFSKALLALRGSEAEVELRPWLYRIVRNTALNDLRGRAPAATELSEALPGARSAAAEVEAREELRDLMARLQALPETQRAALVMRELEGLSHEEIAAALGVSGGAARQAIFRARAALREGFGLLVPLPALRALVDYGGESAAAGAGAALGGGALKAGLATALIAGAVGAGVAVEHHHERGAGPAAAEAAPLIGGRHSRDRTTHASAAQSSFSSDDGRHSGNGRSGGNRGNGSSSSSDDGGSGSPSDGDHGGSGGSGPSGHDSHSEPPHSSSGSGGSNSGSGDVSGSGDRRGGRSGSDDDGGGSSGSGSGSGGSDSGGSSDDGGGTSGGSGSDDGLAGSGDGGASGSGSGELASESTASGETTLSNDSTDNGDSGSGGGSDGGGEPSTSTSGSGDLGGAESTSGSDGSR
ncbi:MAG TPA: RNA polymerase sigma factor [Solirubrobacterales bacterium]|nr:RNA polymerase sigma factor [Solirubrobacterales bacterium]